MIVVASTRYADRAVRMLVPLALALLRVIAAAMCAAAAAALISTLTTGVAAAEGMEWLQAVSSYAAMLGVLFGAGSIAMFALMPKAADLTRRDPHDQGATLPLAATGALAGLGVVAVLHMPAVPPWWAANLRLLGEITGTEPDPLGFYLVPGVLLFAAPVVVSLTLVSFALASLVALLARAHLAARALAACVALQAGLVTGQYVMDRAFGDLGAAVQRLVDSSAEPAASARVADWLERYDRAAGSLDVRVVWLFAGYVLALVLVWAFGPRRRTSETLASATTAHLGGGVPHVAPAAIVPNRLVTTPRPTPEPAPADFAEPLYSIRPRHSWLDALWIGSSEYDIASIPPMSRARFSLSWGRGALRREPHGADLLNIRVSRAGWPLSRATYAVTDARTGAPVGSLVPAGPDWAIHDPLGEAVAHVRVIDESAGLAKYVASDGGQEICRFVWGFAGLTVASAEMQVEILRDACTRLNPALAVILGAVLERQARRASYRHTT